MYHTIAIRAACSLFTARWDFSMRSYWPLSDLMFLNISNDEIKAKRLRGGEKTVHNFFQCHTFINMESLNPSHALLFRWHSIKIRLNFIHVLMCHPQPFKTYVKLASYNCICELLTATKHSIFSHFVLCCCHSCCCGTRPHNISIHCCVKTFINPNKRMQIKSFTDFW